MTRSCYRRIGACWMSSGGIRPRRLQSWDMSLVKHGLPLHAAALRRLCGISIGNLIDTALGIATDDEDIDEADRAEVVEQILTARCRRDAARLGAKRVERSRFDHGAAYRHGSE